MDACHTARESTAFLDRAGATLETVFGFQTFREGQTEALEAVAAGKDCLVIMPTGSGKSLCYQVPALCLPGVTLVVSPLIALMKDQVDALAIRGLAVTCINSSIPVDEQWARLDAMRAGAFKLVYVAPERFRSSAFRKALSAVEVSLLAIDEAHCISQWGHDFRPDYRRLRQVRELLSSVPAIALTATATPEVQADIVRELEMEEPVRVVTGFDRPNLRFSVRKVSGEAQKYEALKVFIETITDSTANDLPSGIIYTGTRRHAGEVADFVNAAVSATTPGERAYCRAYHAGLQDDERREVQEDFMEGRLPCVAATNAFGMGVDKSDIRFVVHFDLPGSVESYYQEVGRAGRDGLPAECVLLFSEGDRRLQEFFIEGSNPNRETIEGVHRLLWDLGENPIFRSLGDLEALLEASGALPKRTSSMGFRSALSVLERAGALDRLDHYENLAEVRPGDGSVWEANPFAARAAVKHALWDALRKVFERTDGEAAGLGLEHWSESIGLSVDSLRRGLLQLQEAGWIRYVPPFRGRAIRLPERRRTLDEIGVDFDALTKRRQRDEERLHQMLAFARSHTCRRNHILHHFGEELPGSGCGTCDACREDGHAAAEVPAGKRPLEEGEFTIVRKILSGVARVRGRCGRQRIIQMLLGSRAQPVLDLGLHELTTYGILKGMRRSVIQEILDQLAAAGCLRQAGDPYPVLYLTEQGVRVMKDEERPELAYPRSRTGVTDAASTDLDAGEEEVFQRLRHLRRSLAAELAVPAFRIFNDRTLKAMARERPQTPEALLNVPGVGAVTLERFGDLFLNELRSSGLDATMGESRQQPLQETEE